MSAAFGRCSCDPPTTWYPESSWVKCARCGWERGERPGANVRRPTHRVGLTLFVQADDDDKAGLIAESFYERFAKEAQEVAGVMWLHPVADIRTATRG